jgi:hypothetical protein
MLDRLELLWKGLSLVLAALLIAQLARWSMHRSRSEDVSMAMPDLPVKSAKASTNAMPEGPGTVPGAPVAPLPALPAPLQGRVDRIVESEILGPVRRPLPMALLGIGGRDAFLRTPSGMTGLLREGEELGGVKLIRIGTNRVLIEHEGQTKELTLFSGFGGASLMPPPKENPK